MRVLAAVTATGILLASLGSAADAARRPAGVSVFWERVAQCETGSRWDWGAQHRPAEGPLYEGGVGFYYATWATWKTHVAAARRYRHAYQAPPWVQARVAAYGLSVGGYWGSLHGAHPCA